MLACRQEKFLQRVAAAKRQIEESVLQKHVRDQSKLERKAARQRLVMQEVSVFDRHKGLLVDAHVLVVHLPPT